MNNAAVNMGVQLNTYFISMFFLFLIADEEKLMRAKSSILNWCLNFSLGIRSFEYFNQP